MLRVAIEDFQQLSKEELKTEKNCLYFDAKTGARFATVERGIWYN